MRIGLLVGALTYFKSFGPVVEAALREQVDVWLLLRDPPELRQGPKAYLRPDPAQVPVFASGAPNVRQWRTDEELVELCVREQIEVVIAVWLYPRDYGLCRALQARGVRWLSLQHGVEHLAMPAQSLLDADATAMFAPYWTTHARRFFGTDGLESKLAVTGHPALDALTAIDRHAVRRRHGIPEGKPVVVWLPHDYHDWDLWEMLAFRRDWRPGFLARALRGRRWDLVPDLFRGVTHARLMRSLREFCDRQGACLVVKSRIKDRPARADREAADMFLFDQAYHPPTILELLAAADLCVHVFSVAAMEAAAAGVPGLCLVPPRASAFIADPDTAWRRTSDDFLGPETLWNFSGVAFMLGMQQAIERLPAMPLDAFRLDASRRAQYLERFVGPVDGQNARRVLHAAQDLAGAQVAE